MAFAMTSVVARSVPTTSTARSPLPSTPRS